LLLKLYFILFRGLDVVSANCVVSMLRDLANCGKTIICTIHQASASQLEMFNALYILSPTGQCIYHGQSSRLISYLSSVGLHCPLHHNPADFGMLNFLFLSIYLILYSNIIENIFIF